MVTEPFNCISGLFSQRLWLFPALAVGASEKSMVTVSLTGVQLPFPVVVKVKVTEPLLISDWVGVYSAFSALAEGENDPKPPLQVPPVATVTLPLSEAVGLFSQTTMS